MIKHIDTGNNAGAEDRNRDQAKGGGGENQSTPENASQPTNESKDQAKSTGQSEATSEAKKSTNQDFDRFDDDLEINLGPVNHEGLKRPKGLSKDSPAHIENLYRLLGLTYPSGEKETSSKNKPEGAGTYSKSAGSGVSDNLGDLLDGIFGGNGSSPFGNSNKKGSGGFPFGSSSNRSGQKGSGSGNGRGGNNAGKGGEGNSAGKGSPGGPRKWKFSPLSWAIAVLAVIFAVVSISAQVWTEVLWYQQSTYQRVLYTQWIATAGMFLLAFLVTWLILATNLKIAYKTRPSAHELPTSIRGYHNLMVRQSRWKILLFPMLIAVPAGVSMSSYWRQVLLAIFGGSFGERDPQFHLDVSFFVFKLPVIDLAVNFLLLLFLGTVVISAAIQYLLGGIQVVPKVRATKAARIQLGVLLAIASVLVGVRYFIERYTLLFADGRPTDGAMYTAVNAVLPAKTILAIIGVVIALLFLFAAVRGGWYLPATGIVVTVASALVIGVGYPVVIQKFRVNPNEREFEKPYIERNIKATLKAFGLDQIEHETYNAATTDTQPGQLRKDADSTQQIRLLDPEIISPAVRQMKQSRPYYSFPEQFSVDRYTFTNKETGEKEKRDTVIAVRDINQDGLAASQRNWVNDHTVYTHGFGVVAAYGSQVTTEGLPSYWESSLSEGETGDIGEYEKRVYFSKYSPQYSIVGAPKGADPKELDYPDAKKNDSQVYNTFQGSGGPSVGNFWNKLLYAIKFGSTDLFFSDQINEKSQILYDRDPVQRVAKVAPYLTLDSRVYPAVVDMDDNPATPKRLVWVVDAYTTTNSYPYAQHIDLTSATADTATEATTQFATENHVNYMRNSVKAVVDAYDGSVSLYQWDKKDPLLKAWQSIYPGQIKPLEDISGDLMAHMRYPEDIFKVQRSLLANYHVTNPSQFYTGGDQWKLSEDPTATSRSLTGTSKLQPPYYLTMKMPSQETAEFSLTSVYIPGGEGKRAAMAGFLAVDSETGNQKGKIREGYGKMRIISLPSDTTVPGPGQVQNTFNSNSTVNKELNLQDQQGSKVIRGNLLTLPVGGGLLYVQPVYVQSTGTTQFPQLRNVLVGFGDKIGFAPTLKEALDQVFGGDSGGVTSETVTGDGTAVDPNKDSTKTEASKSADSNATSTPSTKNVKNPELAQALQAANQAMQDSDKARREGDWAAYGDAQKRLQDALNKAISIQNK